MTTSAPIQDHQHPPQTIWAIDHYPSSRRPTPPPHTDSASSSSPHTLPHTSVPSNLLSFFQSRPPPQTIPVIPNPPSSKLTQPILIPTTTPTLSSGFPYPTPLGSHDIKPTDWALFSNTVANSGRLSKHDKAKALTKGIGKGILFGFCSVRKAQMASERARKKMEVKKVLGVGMGGGIVGTKGIEENRSGMGEQSASGMGSSAGSELDLLINMWNTHFFNPRGIRVHIEPPLDVTSHLSHNLLPSIITQAHISSSSDRDSGIGLEDSHHNPSASSGGNRLKRMSLDNIRSKWRPRGGGVIGARDRDKEKETMEQREARERLNKFRVIAEPWPSEEMI